MVEFCLWKMFRWAQSTHFMPLEHFASGSKLISVKTAPLFFLLQLNLNDCLLCIPMNHLKMHRWPVWAVCIFAMRALSYNGNSSFIFTFARKKWEKKTVFVWREEYLCCLQSVARQLNVWYRVYRICTRQSKCCDCLHEWRHFTFVFFFFYLIWCCDSVSESASSNHNQAHKQLICVAFAYNMRIWISE